MSTRITDLPVATEFNGSEILPLVQNGVTKQSTIDFLNLATPAGLILQQTQQVYQDTVGVKAATDAVLVETQSVLGDTQVVLGQTIGVRNETQALKLDFETQYLGPHASPPTLDNEGNPLENGALYWDTSLMAMFVWDGANWTAFSSAVASVNGFIGEVILGFADVGAAGPGANTNITSLGGLTGDISTTTGVQFDTAAPSAGAVGKLTWNTTDQTLDLGVSASGVVLQVGQEVYYRVKNGTAGVIPNGSMVCYTGTEGLSGNILVAPALANGATASQTFLGLTPETLNPGDSGFATHFGRVRGIDTTGNPYGEVWADGDVIFASSLVAGWLTKVPPAAPNNKVRVGVVVHAHPNGVLFVNPTYGGKLSENEQVELTSLTDGDVLKYVAANSRFENMSFAAAQIETLGTAAASMAAHLLDADPHPQYTTAAEASAAAPVQSVAGKTGAVSLTNADVGLGNVADVLQAAAARVLTAGNGLTGGGDLSANRSFVLGTPSTLTTTTTNEVTATSHTHAVTFPVTSVAGKTGAVALVKADVGLGNVDNTGDANKPVSTATAAALNLKLDKAGGSITGNMNLVVNSASEALRITQTGTGLALRVEDAANPDSTPFVVDANGNVGVKTAAPAVSFAVNAFDAILVPTGSTANRPAGTAGYFRFNTELTQFEGHDGAAWGAISKPDASLVSFQQAGTGAVVRTAQDKMREWVSVKDFGAVGDGVADDTGAVQSAINVAGLLRKPLYIPSGIYRITAPLNLRIATASNADTLTLEGDGDLNSHIWLDSNAAAGVFTYDNGWTAANVAGCSTTSGSGVVTTTGTFAGVAVAGGALAIAGLPVCNIVSVDSPTQITVDRTASATASGLTARVYNTVATAKNRLRLRNLYLTHSQAVTNKTSWHSGTAMHFNGVVNSEFENIRINGFTRGVDMLGGWINDFKKVLTSGCREGFYIELCAYLWVFERCATVNSGGAGNWAGMKLINGGGISLLSHIIEQDNIGLELQGVRGYSIHGGNIESVSYEYSVILKGLPWATTDERHWTQAGDIAGIRIYNSQGILMSNGVKGIRIRANVFELSNPAFAPNGQSWIRTTGESNLVKNVDESGNIFPAGYESITHILAPTGFPTLAMCQSITRDGMRYSSGAPYYGKYWQKGDRLFRLPGDVTAGSYDGWVCTAASSGADGSATWKQFGTVQA